VARRHAFLNGTIDRRTLYFFFELDPADWPGFVNPAGVVDGEALILSFFGFLASLLLRICPLAMIFSLSARQLCAELGFPAKGFGLKFSAWQTRSWTQCDFSGSFGLSVGGPVSSNGEDRAKEKPD
jgi:hypothetical protein